MSEELRVRFVFEYNGLRNNWVLDSSCGVMGTIICIHVYLPRHFGDMLYRKMKELIKQPFGIQLQRR